MSASPPNPSSPLPLSLPARRGPWSSLDLQELVQTLTSQLAAALRPVDPITPVPLPVWVDAVLGLYRAKAATTRYRMSQALRETVAIAGPGATTADLTPGLVATLARRPGAAATTHGLLRALRVACRVAVERKWLDVAPFGRYTPWPRVERRAKRWLSASETATVLEALRVQATDWKGRRLYTLAAVYAYTGLRRMEAIRLKPGDIDFERSLVWVRPHGARLKTKGSEAPVPMPDVLAAILRPWLTECGGEWVFPGEKLRGPWQARTAIWATARIKAAAEAAGVPQATPHAFRRGLATVLRGRGYSREQVKLVLRHTDLGTQEYYVGQDLLTLAALMRKFEL